MLISPIYYQVALESGGSGGVVWRIRANATKLVCAVGSRNGTEETKLLVLDFDVQDAKQRKVWAVQTFMGCLNRRAESCDVTISSAEFKDFNQTMSMTGTNRFTKKERNYLNCKQLFSIATLTSSQHTLPTHLSKYSFCFMYSNQKRKSRGKI